MIIDRIRRDMSVISADDHCVGFVCGFEGENSLRITCISEGYGYDHLIPTTWVTAVEKYVFLDKTISYVLANWEHAQLPRMLSGSAAAPANATTLPVQTEAA